MLQFEVHVSVSSTQAASKLCPAITRAIATGLRKANLALGYTNSTPSFALLCPCGKGDPHPATIGDKSWICTVDAGVGKEFTLNQMFWATEDNKSEEHADQGAMEASSGSDGKAVKCKPTSDHHNNGQSSASAALSEGATVASAEISLQDVAAQAGINRLEVLDEECSQQTLLCLSKHCVDWQLIGFHLELTDSDISAVDGDNRTVDEKRVGVLRRWKEKFAFHATYRILIKSLLACGRTSDAVNACKAIISGVVKEQVMFNSSMSEEEFFKWLKSRGISDKDCKALSENGVTPSGFTQLDAEDFDDVGLTKIGKKLVLKTLAKVKAVHS